MKDNDWKKCVLRADSKDIIKRIPDNSVDLILTDPPYNLASHSTGNIYLPGRAPMNNDVADWDRINFCPEEWADEFIRILKPTGNLFIFTSYNQLGRWYNCLDHKFDTTNFMIWHKTNPAPKIFKAGFLNSCEMIFTCWNKKHTWNFISQAEMHNFVESPICMRPERLNNPKHPAQKPIKILKKIIEIASNKEDIIFDPFMGVGSTGIAALQLGRRFIGVEIDKSYFDAAKKRIETYLDNTTNMKDDTSYHLPSNEVWYAGEEVLAHATSIMDMKRFFRYTVKPEGQEVCSSTTMQPIIKWPGGKEKELKYILPNLPSFQRFFEPFVGGGAVFTSVSAKEYFINDLSSELISLYEYIASSHPTFFHYAEAINQSWKRAEQFFTQHPEIAHIYLQFRQEDLQQEELKRKLTAFCHDYDSDIQQITGEQLNSFPRTLHKELVNNLFRKMSRMRELEKKQALSNADLRGNLQTAVKSALYMNYRQWYNDKVLRESNKPLHIALFFFLRNYAYSGMFRYSSKGDFNVPYGGMAYNAKLLTKKLTYYQSALLLKHFSKAHIFNKDFEEFLRKCEPTTQDFVFLDPPYDSEFSTYAQNAFTHKDHQRLANYLINECKAKWMLVIKSTNFILSLYQKKGIYIRTFDKEYLVSFMNRNDKKATHLLITNYTPSN